VGASYTWRGGLEVPGGAVAVTLWPQAKDPSKDGFKQLAPNGSGIRQKLVDSDGNEVARSDLGKGYDTGAGLLRIDERILGHMDRTGLAAMNGLHPVESVPIESARKIYRVRPDKDSPGAAENLELFWNGLLANGLAYVTELTMRSGSRDKLLALYATEDDFFAAELPYHAELRLDAPAFTLERNEKQASVFAQFVELMEIETPAFDHEAIESQWSRRRDDAITAAMSDQPLPEVEEPKPTPQTPDLMAALEASIASAKKAAPAKKATPRKKVTR
jgi:non-homologous end joining protein Ku